MSVELVQPLELLKAKDPEGETRMGLELPQDLTDDQVRAVCRWLGELRSWSAWAIGDVILYAESISDDLMAEVVEYLECAKSTCSKYAWLASKYNLNQRVPRISPTHHEIVATLPAGERRKMLLEARREGWSSEEFRGLVRPSWQNGGGPCTCNPNPDCPQHGILEP